MSDGHPVSRGPGRSNVRGALITLVLEALIVVVLGLVGLGIAFLMLWAAG
jgi:hypothetical protein